MEEIMTGMIPVPLQLTTLVGNHLRLSTILVHQVGVFLTVEVMAYGKLQDSQTRHVIAQMKEYHSVSAVHPPLGIQLRVLARTAKGRCTMSAASATIGQFLLTAAAHASCTSTTMAMSIRRAAAVGRWASQSVASKNQSNSISESVCPSVARAYGHAF